MEDINELVDIMTKEELTNVVKYYAISIQGFNKNMDRVPINMLKSSVKSELLNGVKRANKQRGKKYTTLKEVQKLLARRFSTLLEDKQTFTHFAEQLEFERHYTKAEIIAFLGLHFPDEYNKYKLKIKENLHNDLFVLTEIVTPKSIEDKMEVYKKSLVKDDHYKKLLNEMENEVKQLIGMKEYNNLIQNVIKGGEHFLFTSLIKETNEEKKWCTIVIFLGHNNHYGELQNASLLTFVTNAYHSYRAQLKTQEIKELQKNIDEYQREIEQFEELEKRYSNLKSTHKTINLRYKTILKEQNEYIENVEQIKSNQEQLKEIKIIFESLFQRKKFIIITDESYFLKNTLFSNFILSIDEFSTELNKNISSILQGHLIFITRISYATSSLWTSHEKQLKRKNISYMELSGYNFEMYIEQMLEFAFKKEQSKI